MLTFFHAYCLCPRIAFALRELFFLFSASFIHGRKKVGSRHSKLNYEIKPGISFIAKIKDKKLGKEMTRASFQTTFHVKNEFFYNQIRSES